MGGGGVAVDNEINKAVRLSNIFHSRQKKEEEKK